MKIAVSACLLGHNCKYNGKNNADSELLDRLKEHEIIPFCPEVEGGLSIPRTPCEIVQGKVISKTGVDRTKEYTLGAQRVINRLREENVDLVIVQPRSPSCGKYRRYDGTFSGQLVEGMGVFSNLALENGFKIMEPVEFLSCNALGNVLKSD